MNRHIVKPAACLAFGLALAAPHARADYSFAGSGTGGNFSGQASEPWAANFDFQYGGTQPDWGSPGVAAGLTPYQEAEAAFGLDLSFSGSSPIDPSSIAIGNAAACAGSTSGGTTLCTFSPTVVWDAFQTGPQSIAFRAQSPTYFLTRGQSYFVNVFFQGGVAPTSFTGTWLTTFTPTVPEPGGAAMLVAGLLGVVSVARLRRRELN